MSENNLETSGSKFDTLNMQSENQSDENHDFEIALHEMPQGYCFETVNVEQITQSSIVAQAPIETNANSSLIVEEVPEEIKLMEHNVAAESSQLVKEELPLISEATNLFELPSRRRGNIIMVKINVSCSGNSREVTTEVSNLPTSVNTLAEKNGSEVLIDSAGTNNGHTSGTSNEGNRCHFYRQRVQIEVPIIISSDDESDIDINVAEHSSFRRNDQQQINCSDVPKDSFSSIADFPEENAVITDENQTNVANDVTKDSLNSIANTPVENAKNIVADVSYRTTVIPMKNELSNQQETNSSDVPKDVLNPVDDMSMMTEVDDQQQTNCSNVPNDTFSSIADISEENDVITDENQTKDVPKDSLNSVAYTPAENAENIVADVLYRTTVIPIDNEFAQANNSSDVQKGVLNPTADMSIVTGVDDQHRTNYSEVTKDSFNSIDENQTNVAFDIQKDLLDSIGDIPVENTVITEQINSTSANDSTETYNRCKGQLKGIPADEQNHKESWAVTIADDLDQVSIDSIDTIVELEELESPTKERVNVTECNKPAYDDTDYHDTEELTLILSEDDNDLDIFNLSSNEFSNEKHNSKDAVTDEVILLSDTEEPIFSNEEDDPNRLPDKRTFGTISRSDNQILFDRIKSGTLDLLKLYPILNLVKGINEAFTKAEPVTTNELLDIGKRFVDASIQAKESDVHAKYDPDETLNSFVDLSIEPEAQVEEALLNVDCKELKVQGFEEKTDGQSSNLTKRRAEKSHDNILTAVQVPRSSKKAKNTKDDVDMKSKETDRKIIKGKKRSMADSYQTSTPIVPAEKKPKFSLRRRFFGRSLLNLGAKWRDQGRKIKSKLGLKSQRTSAGNFNVTPFPKEEDCEDVSGFSVIPTHFFGGDSM